MSTHDATLCYYNAAGEMITTTWNNACASLIVESLPIRLPPTYRGQRNYPGLFWAATNQRMLVYASLLELDRLWLADFDPTVSAISTQPFHIAGADVVTERSHVPNIMLIHADDSATVIDVCSQSVLARRQVREQHEWTRELCRGKGWDYEIFSGADATVLRNVRALSIGRRSDRLSADLVDQACEAVSRSPMTLGEAIAARPSGRDDASWRVALAACLWTGQASADLQQPLSNDTVLNSAEGTAA